jgi:hypothetical protein
MIHDHRLAPEQIAHGAIFADLRAQVRRDDNDLIEHRVRAVLQLPHPEHDLRLG